MKLTRAKQKRRGRWSYCAGERGRNRVRAYQDAKSGLLFVDYHEQPLGAPAPVRKRESLQTRDRELAKRLVDELAAAFTKTERRRGADLTVRALFDIYLREVTPNKGQSKREHDHRCAEMLLRFLGSDRKPTTLSRRDWDRFIAARRGGTIAPLNARSSEGVGERVIAYDLTFLAGVLNWATVSGSDGGDGMLLERNPLHGLPMPKNESPRRPKLSEEQYQALLAVAPEVSDGFALALVLAHDTGHRIGSVRQLRWSDIDLDHGFILWRASTDKIGFAHAVPIEEGTVAVLRAARATDRDAPGNTCVFPLRRDPTQPVSRHLMRDWWERAAAKAGLPAGERLGWHSLRRKYASEMMHLDPKNLCYSGGWKSHQTVLTCYQQPDLERQREALRQRQQRRAHAASTANWQ